MVDSEAAALFPHNAISLISHNSVTQDLNLLQPLDLLFKIDYIYNDGF